MVNSKNVDCWKWLGWPAVQERCVLTINEMAREALRKAGNDTAKAEKALRKSLSEEDLSKLVSHAIHEAIREAARHDRRRRFKTIGSPPDPHRKADMAALKSCGIRNHLMMVLPGGCLLGEAGHNELAAARDLWQQNADSNARRATWAGAIIAALPKGKRVKDAFSNEKLEELSAQIGLKEAA